MTLPIDHNVPMPHNEQWWFANISNKNMKPNHYPPKLKRHLAAVLKRQFSRTELAVINSESGKLLKRKKRA